MPLPLLAIAAALLYLAAAGLHLMHILQRKPRLSTSVIALGGVALACHALVAWSSVFDEHSVHLGLYRILALISFVINLVCVTWLVRWPLQNLLIVLLPLSASTVLISAFAPQTSTTPEALDNGLLIHIASSILAYAVLTIAAVQAALLAVQDRQLKQHRATGIVSFLPPLQLMRAVTTSVCGATVQCSCGACWCAPATARASDRATRAVRCPDAHTSVAPT